MEKRAYLGWLVWQEGKNLFFLKEINGQGEKTQRKSPDIHVRKLPGNKN